MKSGHYTNVIAEKLRSNLLADQERYAGIEVYSDHGDSGSEYTCQPTSYMGQRYGSDATLSEIDIVVTKNGKVILAVEVEESEVRPKVVLGDVFGVAIASKIMIKGKPHKIADTVLIVALVAKKTGHRADKYVRLERLLIKQMKLLRDAGGTGVNKVRIITSSIDDLAIRIERLLRSEIGKIAAAG
jgi:hypothetical protein